MKSRSAICLFVALDAASSATCRSVGVSSQGAIVKQLEPVVSAFAAQLVPRSPAARLWWLIREDALLTTIVGGVTVALIVALIFAAVHSL